MELEDEIALNHPEDIDLLHPEELRNQTISELKSNILFNQNQLDYITVCKRNLEQAKENKLRSYSRGTFPRVTQLFHTVTNYRYSPIEKVELEIIRCDAELEVAKENLKSLQQQMRMYQIAKVHDWMLANPNCYDKKDRDKVFKELLEALEKDELGFIDLTEKLLINPRIKTTSV